MCLLDVVVLSTDFSGMDSRLPQHVGDSPPRKDVIGLFESFKAMSTAHGIHHINHAYGID